MYQEIDTVCRFILMGFFLIFTILSFLNYKKAKKNGLKVSAKYFPDFLSRYKKDYSREWEKTFSTDKESPNYA